MSNYDPSALGSIPTIEGETLGPDERGDIPQPTPDDVSSFLSPTDLQALAAAAAGSPDAHLRLEAAIAYVTNPDCSTIKALAQNPKFAGRVSPDTLKRWRKTDKWDEYRKRFFTAWLMNVTQTAGSELVQAKRNEMRDLQQVMRLAMAKINDPEVLPKSWEGVVKVLLELGKRGDQVGAQIREELSLQAQMKKQLDDSEDEIAEDEVDDQQLKDIVAQVMSQRREALRAKNDTPVEETGILPEDLKGLLNASRDGMSEEPEDDDED